jgi:S-phase kinase-associated protein 1
MATTNPEGVKLISITTSDGVHMEVERPVAERSILIKNLLEDLGGDATESIPIPNVCTHLPRYLQEHSLTGRRSTRPL